MTADTTPYVRQSLIGVPNGVAMLDGSGNVPLDELGNAPGGGGDPLASQCVQVSTDGTSAPVAAFGAVTLPLIGIDSTAQASFSIGPIGNGPATTFFQYPHTVGSDWSGISSSDISAGIYIYATNAGLTEGLEIYTASLTIAHSSSVLLSQSDFSVGSTVGSDLSLNSTGIVSAAGTPYWVVVYVSIDWSAL